MSSSLNRFLYIFLDEAGDFDFSSNGSKHLMVASVTRERPFGDYEAFIKLKYELIEQGLNIEYFTLLRISKPFVTGYLPSLARI